LSEDYVLTKLEQIDAIVGEIRSHLKGDRKPSAEAKPQGSPKLKFDAQKIKWVETLDRNNMPYRLATDQNNVGNADYAEAKELLRSGGGKFSQKDGLSWLLFPDGDAVGVWDYKRR
jgi:hypothetical protein